MVANSFLGQCSVWLPTKRLFLPPCFQEQEQNSTNQYRVGNESWIKGEWVTHAKVYINFHITTTSQTNYLYNQDPRTVFESEVSCSNKSLKENVVNPSFSPVLSCTFPHSWINLQKCLVCSIWEMMNNVKSVIFIPGRQCLPVLLWMSWGHSCFVSHLAASPLCQHFPSLSAHHIYCHLLWTGF